MRLGGRLLVQVLLGLLLLGLGAMAAFCQDTRLEQLSPQEEAMWQARLRRNPCDARSHYYLGRFYEFHHRLSQAAASFRQATLHNPGWPQAFFQLGKVYRQLYRYHEAQTALRRAVLLKTDYGQASHFLGLVNIDLRRYDEAAAAFLKAYELDPGWAEKYYDLTTYGIHNELGDKDTVLQLVKRIYPKNQRLAYLLYNRWSRGNAGQQEFYQMVAGLDKVSETGYQKPEMPGYQEPLESGYLRPPEAGFLRGHEGHHRR